jgi:DNA-binding winged helix-turn-helix (wHTH) protein
MSVRFAFASFELDPQRRRLTLAGEPVAIPDRHLDVLTALVARAGRIVAKDDLLEAGWKDVAVGDNSLEQAISSLRRQLAALSQGVAFIETVPRRGYRFTAPVQRTAVREEDSVLDALLAPHRAFLEGRAALETLSADGVARARGVFEEAVRIAPEQAAAHVGLANACAMQYEMTRADPEPSTGALDRAAEHAREACRLDPHWAEAWATLGFVLDRTGHRRDAAAASRRAVNLEPGNWRHHFRLSYVSWGEERLSAAHRTLSLLPGFALAHWLAATVYVARQALDEAERELTTGLAAGGLTAAGSRFSSVALHWLLGLIRLNRGDEEGALQAFERELSAESAGQLYGRECAANTWYAIGALRLRQGRAADAGIAFTEAVNRVSRHALAELGLGVVASVGALPVRTARTGGATGVLPGGFDGALIRAVVLSFSGHHEAAAEAIDHALAESPPGNAGWLLPVEPLLYVSSHAAIWAPALARLRNRAA